jgi:hypothetical protein
VPAAFIALLVTGWSARADVISITAGQFNAGSSLITFEGIPNGTNVNGPVTSGVTFGVTSNNVPTNAVVISPSPAGPTNNAAVTVVNGTPIPPAVALTLNLPAPATQFGYGYAIATLGVVPNATTIELFSGGISVGTLSYTGSPDPTFAGGFAGIQSTVPFDRARITFSQPTAPAFLVDNVRFNRAAVPEPLSVAVFGGLVAVGGLVARRRVKAA